MYFILKTVIKGGTHTFILILFKYSSNTTNIFYVATEAIISVIALIPDSKVPLLCPAIGYVKTLNILIVYYFPDLSIQ